MTKVTIELTAEQAVKVLTFLGTNPAPTASAPTPVASAPAAPQAPTPPAPPVAPAAPIATAPQAPSAPVAPQAPALQPTAPAAVAGGEITAGQVAQAAQNYAKTHTPKAAKAVFTQFGLTKVSDARPDQYPALLQALAV